MRTVKSSDRTLALLELFSREQRAFTVSSVMKALKMPQSSASMLLQNLTRLGYLEYDRHHRTFCPSIRVALLGSWIDRGFNDAGNLANLVIGLGERLNLRVFVAIQNEANIQYVISRWPDRPDQ